MRTRPFFATAVTAGTERPPRRRRSSIANAFAALLLVLLGLVSCGKSPMQPKSGVYDFSLVDVNPNSATYGQTVSSSSLVGRPVVIFIGVAT